MQPTLSRRHPKTAGGLHNIQQQYKPQNTKVKITIIFADIISSNSIIFGGGGGGGAGGGAGGGGGDDDDSKKNRC